MGKRVLLVDDNKALVETLKESLEERGFKCDCAFNAKEGFAVFINKSPDIIITDDIMEDISAGFRLVKDIRTEEEKSDSAKVPILMLSALKNVTDLDFKERVGTPVLQVNDMLYKPVNPDKVISAINNLLK
ncbi:response regulator transcription factor [bacterium]|nr:response regulator transcription factor [bacterium]